MMRTEETNRWMRPSALVLAAMAALAMTACGRNRSPLEQAGHEIDDVAEDVSEEVDEATE
jgi:hypothetical protein